MSEGKKSQNTNAAKEKGDMHLRSIVTKAKICIWFTLSRKLYVTLI